MFYGLFLQASFRPPELLSGERDPAREFSPDVVPGTPDPPLRLKNGSVQDDSRGDDIFEGLALHPDARRKRHSC
jgi:hypothetical protein